MLAHLKMLVLFKVNPQMIESCEMVGPVNDDNVYIMMNCLCKLFPGPTILVKIMMIVMMRMLT